MRAFIEFHDGVTAEVGLDEQVEVVTEGRRVLFRLEVCEWREVVFDAVVSVTNLAEFERGNGPHRNVHPVAIWCEIPQAGEVSGTWDAGPDVALSFANGWHVGIRDGRMKGGGAAVSVEDGKRIRVDLLRNVPQARRPWVGQWDQQVDDGQDADPVSLEAPTLPGGRMACWRVIASVNALRISLDPIPEPKPEWYELTAPWVAPEERLGRYQALLDSWCRWGFRGAIASDGGGAASFASYFTQRERRWETWDRNGEGDYFDRPEGQDSLHWLAWPDVWWADGHTNCHYALVWVAWRAWLDAMRTDDQVRRSASWWIFCRLAEWYTTTGLCWSDESPFEGWSWYEKSSRGPTQAYPGSYPFTNLANYKQYATNALAASVLPWPHVQRGVTANLDACRHRGTEFWDGKWSSGRGPAWGLIDAYYAWRMTGDASWRPLIRDRAVNLLDRARPDGSWVNPSSGGDGISNVFENGKAIVALALVHTEGLLDGDDADRLDAFLRIACARFRDHVGLIEGWPYCARLFAPDGVPARYGSRGNRDGDVNLPQAGAFTMVWAALVLGYDAVAFGSEESRELFLPLAETLGVTLDGGPRPGWDLGEVEQSPAGANRWPATNIREAHAGTQPSGPFNWWVRDGWNSVKNEAQVLMWGDAICWMHRELTKDAEG